MTVKAMVLRSPGANCDVETAYALECAGAVADRIHINRLRERPQMLHDYHILVVPGGFTYGDDVAAGKILANQLSSFLSDALQSFRDRERLILGICNGFQALLKAGLLVPPDEDGPLATLTHNDSGRFEDRWTYLQATSSRCPMLKGCRHLYLPVAHGEGKFICREPWILHGLQESGQVVLRYTGLALRDEEVGYPANPNGSEGNVAGICDATGRVLGLMPHPERHILPTQHPRWTREELATEGDGMRIFRNIVEYFL
ncbi:MAG: phosphoribosylformylglycinamidine synthase [Gemmatales bacterium]|nr:MAG: phosphoribosylformylglycinamidine synthase [Gemmatales bacterium]